MMWTNSLLIAAIANSWVAYQLAWAQQVFTPQCNDFNSNATITAAQSKAAGVDAVTAHNVAVALNYERSNWAHGSAADDEFYHVPPNTAHAPAGTLLKVQVDANTSLYTLPPNTALSRIMFQTKTLNGTLAPASAYVLWPYMPRAQPDGYPVIAWAHGNSGAFVECGPSHYRYLLYQFAAPYTLALQGYVVVAPDYLGLGVGKDATGKLLRHPLLAVPSQANDLFYAVQAAQSAFKELSKQFVVVGHSQGGGAAWAAAERQATHPVKGYLGSVAGSPITDFIAVAQLAGSLADSGAILLAPSLLGIFPTFKLSDFLTPAGEARSALLSQIQGCNAVSSSGILAGTGLVKANWSESFYATAYQNLARAGGRRIAGPMIVLQGEADPAVPLPVTSVAINKTCTLYPDSRLEYVTFANVTHVPVLYASQRIWLQWIEDRFAGRAATRGCQQSRHSSARPYRYYQAETNWFIEYAIQIYELA